ncbi:glucose 1-dehydrogenase [Puniceicoccales bacterium CK1056]|uniref:Glucose 1-dehydrogenase n=1 Tax=Oceanipulchritudo coccoides TaxID=2706888 RepID=A0A6B2M0A2_9BACT|nr:glucose 1-dehydrogenase [Oceanipulchritudo coccoides]NDV61604.1 glucose 1-dehydrogenase [Oceanipulchritudo coccoides]
MSTLTGKVALVTGGTSGIGRATAELLTKNGATVVITGRREAEGKETVRLVEEAGGKCVFIQGDMSLEADIEKAVSETVSQFGKLDIAVNNAGVEVAGMVPEIDKESFDKVFGVNVWGVLASMKHEIPVMLKNGGGSIINMSSIAGHIGAPGLSIYIASKHAVEGLTKVAALETAQQGIRINAVAPAVIETAMAERLFGGDEETRTGMIARHPIGRFGVSKEVAEAVLWLASDASSYTTGHSLPVDGGFLAT